MTAPRTPEDVIRDTLRDTGHAQLTHHHRTDVIMQRLTASGYEITDTLQPGLYDRKRVEAALSTAADAVRELLNPEDTENSDTIMADDTLNLMVNAAVYLLDHPDADIDDVIAAQYTDVTLDDYDFEGIVPEGTPVPEKGSQEWNKAVARKVRGWFE